MRYLSRIALVFAVGAWMSCTGSPENERGPDAGTERSELVQSPAPGSTADDLTTPEGFAGAVALVGSSPETADCLAVLVSRFWALTSYDCASGSSSHVYFPQAEGTEDFAYWAGTQTFRHGLALLRLD